MNDDQDQSIHLSPPGAVPNDLCPNGQIGRKGKAIKGEGVWEHCRCCKGGYGIGNVPLTTMSSMFPMTPKGKLLGQPSRFCASLKIIE